MMATVEPRMLSNVGLAVAFPALSFLGAWPAVATEQTAKAWGWVRWRIAGTPTRDNSRVLRLRQRAGRRFPGWFPGSSRIGAGIQRFSVAGRGIAGNSLGVLKRWFSVPITLNAKRGFWGFFAAAFLVSVCRNGAARRAGQAALLANNGSNSGAGMTYSPR